MAINISSIENRSRPHAYELTYDIFLSWALALLWVVIVYFTQLLLFQVLFTYSYWL